MSELLAAADEAVRARLSAPSYEHSVRVSETAASLAMLYGEDPDAARVAGLLHDWDRELDEDELGQAADRQGLAQSEADRAVPYLVHARTGAAGVEEAFAGIAPEISEAIASHTVGSPSMGALAMIVYIADSIEPARQHEGVDSLREAVGTIGLDELFALAYQQSMTHLVRSRKWIHPDTVAVWNAHVARRAR